MKAKALVALLTGTLVGVGVWTGMSRNTSAAHAGSNLVPVVRHARSPLRGGQYLYVQSESAFTATAGRFSTIATDHQKRWTGADGSGRFVDMIGPSHFLSARDHDNWVAAGRPRLPNGSDDITFPPGCLTLRDLSSLPTDPAALRSLLFRRKIEGGPPGRVEDFVQIGDLLRNTVTSPALRVALYEVASSLRQVEQLGPVTDHAGRKGLGLAMTSTSNPSPDTRQELILNPRTKALMGESETITGRRSGYAAPIDTVIGWAVYLHQGIVDALPPDPASRPAPGICQ